MKNQILLLASTFAERGGWVDDRQFFDLVGSTYLLAHGLGEPVADAKTTFVVEQSGTYNLFVRTRNWTVYWSAAPTPGVFEVFVDGVSAGIFGNEKSEWHWQRGIALELEAGEHTVVVHDLTGFDGRFDALLFTTSAKAPKEGVEEYRRLRKQLLGLPSAPVRSGSYDFVVVGGGVAGMCAAIAAARTGSRVALIQDRKVLGGNNSSEIRVGLGGRLNIGMYPSLGYLLNEFAPETKGNARTADIYQDDKKLAAALAEHRITLFMGYRVTEVVKSENRITAVVATDVEKHNRIRVSGRLFADCTGDAVLGVLAGAEWHMGREAKSEYGEQSAPDVVDGMTMGSSLQWYCL
ncbi:MAG: FAD-dependent oxidoreductase, partial [Alistipes sp.]|nr:FAD-dependent oxidoreductase [Alistipes sp.]